MSEKLLCYLSSNHAFYRDAENGIFHINMQNTPGVDKAVRIVPVSVIVPNIFPNVNKYRNTYEEGKNDITIPVGQYSLTELVAQMESLKMGDFTYSVVDGRVTIVNASGFEEAITASTEFFDMLGMQADVVVNPSDGLADLKVGPGATYTAGLPNIGGEKLVILCCDKLAPSNCLHGGDSTTYDVVAHVSLQDTVYGQSAHWQLGDVDAHDIEYKHTNQFDTLVFELKDSRMRPLAFPSNYHVDMMLKVYHRDGKTMWRSRHN